MNRTSSSDWAVFLKKEGSGDDDPGSKAVDDGDGAVVKGLSREEAGEEERHAEYAGYEDGGEVEVRRGMRCHERRGSSPTMLQTWRCGVEVGNGGKGWSYLRGCEFGREEESVDFVEGVLKE